MILLHLNDIVKGDSGVAEHDNWISVDSVSFGVGRSVSTSGAGSDRETSNPSFSEITISKTSDASSCDFFSQAAGGKAIANGKIDWIQQQNGEPKVYMQMELEKPIITGYSCNSGGDRPTETISINFIKFKVHYWQLKEGADATEISPRGWDLKKNAKWD